MKISKLFHWLYAILMLLPFLVFIPNAFYYGFNEHAVAQEKTEQVPVYYESNIVNSSDDLVVGNIYEFNYTGSYTTNGVGISCYNIIVIEGQFNRYSNQPPAYETPYFQKNSNGSVTRIFYDQNNTGYMETAYKFVFVYKGIILGDISNIISYIGETDYQLIKEYQPLTTNMSITDSMSYAWDSVWQNDLFSWSYGSFLTEPFIYIGNVFNVPNDNSLYYALSYWLDISIIWLCFDMVMYIPLLVHRWLDKGIIE